MLPDGNVRSFLTSMAVLRSPFSPEVPAAGIFGSRPRILLRIMESPWYQVEGRKPTDYVADPHPLG